jgi:uncharacterized oxidoreductase
MDLQQANVLITGGSDGIGLGLAKRFQAAGGNVLITGRNADKLAQTGFKSFVSDISKPDDREALAKEGKGSGIWAYKAIGRGFGDDL